VCCVCAVPDPVLRPIRALEASTVIAEMIHRRTGEFFPLKKVFLLNS
jgi:hypothetical protein